jgi:Fe-S cluster biosynthesis and repair protein YggX
MAWTDPLGNAADSQLQFSFDDFINFFLGMEMLMDRCPCVELVMREGHVGRIKIAASPAGKAFDNCQFSGIDERHISAARTFPILHKLENARGNPLALITGSCYNTHMPRMVKCAKLGRELPGLDEPPFDTELGQKIYESVSAEAWKMWAEHSKMLLNEYRLQPWKPEAQQFLVEQMQQYFFGAGAQLPKEFVPPPK